RREIARRAPELVVLRLRPPHQLQFRGQSQAALACERGCFEPGALLVIGTGKADTDFVASKNGICTFGGSVLLVDDLALPPAAGGGIGAEIVEVSVAAENASVV